MDWSAMGRTPVDWDGVIGRNTQALKRIAASLVALAGLAGDKATLPRRLHRVILRLLRPAEAAARRLVIIAARDLVVALPKPRKPAPPRPRPVPVFVRPGSMRTGIVLPHGVRPTDILPGYVPPHPPPRSLRLPLLDTLPRRAAARPRRARFMPRISVPGLTERTPLPRPPAPDDPLDARRLMLRLQALGRALDDLPGEARRFARWRARANALLEARLAAAAAPPAPRQPAGAARPLRLWPLRRGRPPGSRRKPTHEVHDVLADLHHFALEALLPKERRDSS